MEKSIYGYILRHSRRQQIIVTLMAVASFPFLYAFYELPKQIVNEAIQGNVASFPVELAGYSFDQIPYLLLLSGMFLVLIFVNQAFKYIINVYRGLTGERMLRRLRYDLYGRVLRFPQPTFGKLSQGEIIQMINAEVEPIGGFVGESFSLPAFQGGTLLVILGFLLWQNVYLAAAAVVFYPLQLYIIPRLQRRVNLLAKRRVQLARALSDRIGETVAGVQEIHVHDTAAYELAGFSSRLGAIFQARFQIYLWKFVIKFINNSINHLGPFFFYSFGGYLVIAGDLQIGTLVAALAANKDLAAPWKELLAYYQRREDVRIKYEQVVNQFEPPGMMEEEAQLGDPAELKPLTGKVVASSVGLQDDSGNSLLDGVSFSFDSATQVAVVGSGGSGKDQIALLLARLMVPGSGTLNIGDARLADLPEAITGRRLGYVGPSPYLFSTSVRENLFYGLKHRPGPAEDEGAEDSAAEKDRKWRIKEAEASGNTTDDPDSDWIDYEAAGARDMESLARRAIEVLSMVDMDSDIYQLGLRGAIDPAEHPQRAARVLDARAEFLKLLADPEIAALVETFDAERYNENATVGENLLFGSPVGDAFDMDRLAEHPYVLRVLEMTGLTADMLEAGRQVATTMVELFADLPPGHEFFERFSFISHEDLPEYQALLARIGRDGTAELPDEERAMLLSLPFKLVPARHRLGVIDDLKERLLEARRVFAANLPAELAGAVEPFDVNGYNAASTLQDNILFGKLAYGQARGAERVGALLAELVDNLGLRPAVMEVGLGYHVGIAGTRLLPAQRQKLALARSILKRPDILVMNEAMTALDAASYDRMMKAVLEEFNGRGIVWALHRASLARHFGHVIVMRSGRVVEQGSFEDLQQPGRALAELIDAE